MEEGTVPHLGCGEGLGIFPATCGWEEDDVVNCLDELKLHDTLDQHTGEDRVTCHLCNMWVNIVTLSSSVTLLEAVMDSSIILVCSNILHLLKYNNNYAWDLYHDLSCQRQ